MQPEKSSLIADASQPAKKRDVEPSRREYREVRPRIKTGDVFLYKGRCFLKPVVGWIAPATGWFTESPYTHAGMAIRLHERVMVIESIGRGVIVNPCSLSFSRHRSDVDWFTYRGEISDPTREALIRHAAEELGKRFAFWKAFLALMKTKLRLPLKGLDEFEEESRFYCSHFVAHVYNSVGLDLSEGSPDEYMTPRGLAESPKLKKVDSIYKSRESRPPYDATRVRPSGIRRREDAA
jgi:hypothetical protein